MPLTSMVLTSPPPPARVLAPAPAGITLRTPVKATASGRTNLLVTKNAPACRSRTVPALSRQALGLGTAHRNSRVCRSEAVCVQMAWRSSSLRCLRGVPVRSDVTARRTGPVRSRRKAGAPPVRRTAVSGRRSHCRQERSTRGLSSGSTREPTRGPTLGTGARAHGIGMSNINVYVINALLVLLVIRQIREHPLDLRSLAIPVLAVGVAALLFLHSVPLGGNDIALELACVTAGALMGAIGGFATCLRRGAGGRPLGRGGWVGGRVWVCGGGCRCGF